MPMNQMEKVSGLKHHRMGMTSRFISVLMFACLLQLAGGALAVIILGKVVGIADGDTVTVLDASKNQHRIRLEGIDAPEKSMPFGQRAKEHLSNLVFAKDVEVKTSKKDRYGRAIGSIFVNGLDANLAMVNAGMAWHYKKYQKEQSPADRLIYASAEEQARSRRAGLWRDDNPTPPWEYRKGRRDGN